MKEHNTIDNLFRDAFDGLSIMPDASVKSEIDARIFVKNDKRRAGFWLFFVGLGISVFALFAGLYYSTNAYHGESLIGTQRLAENDADVRNSVDTKKQIASTSNEIHDAVPLSSETSDKEMNVLSSINKQETSTRANRTTTTTTSARAQVTQKIQSSNVQSNDSVDKKDEIVGIDHLRLRNISVFDNDLTSDLSIDFNQRGSSLTKPTAEEISTSSHSFAAFVNYGFESTNSNREQVDYNQLENAQIQLRSAAIKVEYKKSFTSVFGWNVGVGYADHSVLQKGRMTTWDSVITQSTISTLTPEVVYVPSYYAATTRYRFQQFQLGLGMTFSYSLLQNCNLDVSLGSDFSLGKLTQLDTNTFYESPAFSNFGMSLYLRPAIEYKVRKYSFLAFGQVNQTLVSQIQWSFIDRRNTGFGGGLACRYYF